jgi:anti-anti-sigma factor
MEPHRLRLDNDLVFSTVDHWKNLLAPVLTRGESDLELDFGSVTMVDSKGFGFLINVFTQLSMKGRKLKIIRVRDDLFQLFRTMRMDQHFTIEAATH